MAKFCKGISGNPGGRPKVLGEVQELARQYAPTAIVELARLALKAKSETARIAAIRELLDRGYGRSRQAMEITAPAGDPLQLLFEELDALSRKTDRYKQEPQRPARSQRLRPPFFAECRRARLTPHKPPRSAEIRSAMRAMPACGAAAPRPLSCLLKPSRCRAWTAGMSGCVCPWLRRSH